MKRISKGILAMSCAAVSLFGFTACDKNSVSIDATVLGTPSKTTQLDYNERNEYKYDSIHESAERFASDFAAIAYKQYEKEENFAVSPLSVYMALSLAAQCSAGETQSEILSALGITYDKLIAGFSDYYRSVIAEYTDRGRFDTKVQTGMIKLTNSVWLDSHTTPKQECIDVLSEKFFCHSYQVEFADDNKAANQAVRQFVKENTKGLIDQDFQLPEETVFTLINTLYLKDIWNSFGDELSFTDKQYSFEQSDGKSKNLKLLQGYYNLGRVFETERYKTFFTETENGNRVDFILPKDGYAVGDVFTAENIEEIKSITSYNEVDHDKKQRFYTRCLFPEFTASYDGFIKELLAEMGITAMFIPDKCDFAGLTDGYVYCENIRHITQLKVDRKGIEGAAVTVELMCGSPGPDGYEEIREDFEIDRAFGFVLSDRYGNTLFSGVVNKV